MYDRRDLERILKNAADIRTRSVSVLHIASKAEGKEGRLCQVQVNVASHVVLGELELGVKGCSRVCGYDSRFVIYTEDETVTEKFCTAAYVCADVRVGCKIVGDKVKPVCRRIEVRILAAAGLVDLCL